MNLTIRKTSTVSRMVGALSSERMMCRPDSGTDIKNTYRCLAFSFPLFCPRKTPIQGEKAPSGIFYAVERRVAT